MLVSIFAVASALAAVAYGFAAALPLTELWKCLLVFVLGIPALSALYVLSAAVVSLFIDPTWPREKQNPLCRAYVADGGGMCCSYCRVRAHLNGGEKLPENERFLLVTNHRSLFDPLMLFNLLKKYNLAFISKPSNMRLPVLGRIAAGACFLPIDRERDREALKTIKAAQEYLRRDLCSICIFPEGTRSKTRELLPFHHGSFKIAQRAPAPLVIAACSGTDQVKKNFPLRRTDVYVDILEVIPAEQVRTMPTAQLAERARTLIEEDLKKREGEV